MNPQKIKEFLKSIKDTDIEEMRYQSEEDFLYFKKSNVTVPIPMASSVENEIIIKEEKKEREKLALISIKSTMVGTFINVQNNNKLPLVKEGDNIVIGQKIGQIEAMKIIKDVYSNAKGKVLKVLVSNGQAVEYGQELFLVDNISDNK
ncbi:MAG: hypothetical protein LBQ99_01865 [Endomicrobium sp.]|jgi:acetyl-CoA carboxylase biotin carboxyl carrier protein|nr:hypothetical protein [Endomicrobium sp.]